MIERLICNPENFQDHYAKIQKNYKENIYISSPGFSSSEKLSYEWINTISENPSLFGLQNKKPFNNGINGSFYQYLLDFMNLPNYDNNTSSSLYNRMLESAKKNQNMENSINNIFQFIESFTNPSLIPKEEGQKDKNNEENKDETDNFELKIPSEENIKNEIEVEKQEEQEEEKKEDKNNDQNNEKTKKIESEEQKVVIPIEENIKEEIKKSYDLVANGFPKEALSLYGIDVEHFNSLIEELKKEALEIGKHNYEIKEEALKKNKKLLNKLKIMTIKENAALNHIFKEKGNNLKENISEQEWEVFCSGMNELNENDRDFFLRTMPYELIRELPSDLRKETKGLRKKFTEFYKNRVVPNENADSCSSSLLTIAEEDKNTNPDDAFENTQSFADELVSGNNEYIFCNYEKNEELEEIFNNLNFYDNLPNIDEELLLKLISFFMYGIQDESSVLAFKMLFKSLCIDPRNSYKIYDSLFFLLYFYQEYKEGLNKDCNKIDGAIFKKYIITERFSISGEIISLENDDLSLKIIGVFKYFLEKKVGLPLFIKSYIYGCNPILFENSSYVSLQLIQNIRNIFCHAKFEAKKENIISKIMIFYAEKSKIDEMKGFIVNLMDVIKFKKDCKEPINLKYPKLIYDSSPEKMASIFTKSMDLEQINESYEIIEKLLSTDIETLINIILSCLNKEFENAARSLKTLKTQLLDFQKEESIISDISSLKDMSKRDSLWSSFYCKCEENYSLIRKLRHISKVILKKLKTSIYQYAKFESKKRINIDHKKENLLIYNELRRKEFKLIVKHILKETNEKIHQNEIILNSFKDYFELAFLTLNIVGTDFSEEDWYPKTIYLNFRKYFVIFIELYRFLNPLDEQEFSSQKEIDSPDLHGLPKLSKMQTRAPEEDIEQFKFKNDKIFAAFESKSDVDISLNNILNMAYGTFSYFVEQFLKNKIKRCSPITMNFFYYIKKAPNDRSISTNIKFFYLK